MRTQTRFTQRIALVAVLALLLALAPTGGFASADEAPDTCKDHPAYDHNYEGNTSGDWGVIVFRPDDGPLVLDVNEGYEVWLCMKKGSEASGMGVVEVGPFVGPLEGVEVDYPGTVPADGFSHYGVRFAEVPETTTTTEETTTTTEETTTTTEETTTTTEETTTTTEETTTTTEDEGVEGIEEEATTTTTAEGEVAGEVVEALPRTGVGSADTALVALASLLIGTGLLAAVRRRQLVA